MKIKHSKYKNTGLVFELLVRQIASDTLAQKESPAIKIIKKFYTGNTALMREYKLYEYVMKSKGVSEKKAETIVTTIYELSKKFNKKTLDTQKYELIKEIKSNYEVDEFFSRKVDNYKTLAATYCLLESQRTPDITDPESFIENQSTILEHLTEDPQRTQKVKNEVLEEYKNSDKDLKMLTYRILLEKFNKEYKDLLPEQKNILKELIISTNSPVRLRAVVNEELSKLRKNIEELKGNVEDEVILIKLNEICKNITPVSNTEKVGDDHLISLMQYYELVNELKNL